MLAFQVYVWPHQMAHCLRDPDVQELVNKQRLKLVLIDQFPELHTVCPRLRLERRGPNAAELLINSSTEADAQVSRCRLLAAWPACADGQFTVSRRPMLHPIGAKAGMERQSQPCKQASRGEYKWNISTPHIACQAVYRVSFEGW